MKRRTFPVWLLILVMVLAPALATAGVGTVVGHSGATPATGHHHHQAKGDHGVSTRAGHCAHQHDDARCSGLSCAFAHCFNVDHQANRAFGAGAFAIASLAEDSYRIPLTSRVVPPLERPPRA